MTTEAIAVGLPVNLALELGLAILPELVNIPARGIEFGARRGMYAGGIESSIIEGRSCDVVDPRRVSTVRTIASAVTAISADAIAVTAVRTVVRPIVGSPLVVESVLIKSCAGVDMKMIVGEAVVV